MFKVNLLGRLGRDAQVFEASNGTQFVGFTVAVNVKGRGGETTTYWVDVRSFNKNHIKLTQYLTKGKIVQVGGDFTTGTMVDKTNTVRVTHNLLADYVTFVNLGGGSPTNNNTNTTTVTPVVVETTPMPVVEQVATQRATIEEDGIVMNTPKMDPVPVTVGASDSVDSDLPF